MKNLQRYLQNTSSSMAVENSFQTFKINLLNKLKVYENF